MVPIFNQTTISLSKARSILGTTHREYSKDELILLMQKIEVLTEVILNTINDSRIRSGIDLSDLKEDN